MQVAGTLAEQTNWACISNYNGRVISLHLLAKLFLPE